MTAENLAEAPSIRRLHYHFLAGGPVSDTDSNAGKYYFGLVFCSHEIKEHELATGLERLPDFRKVSYAIIDVMIRVAEKDRVHEIRF